jgi:hypothetical protein
MLPRSSNYFNIELMVPFEPANLRLQAQPSKLNNISIIKVDIHGTVEFVGRCLMPKDELANVEGGEGSSINRR